MNEIDKNDILCSGFDIAISRSREQDCSQYFFEFIEEIKSSEENGDEKRALVFRCFSMLTGSRLDFHQGNYGKQPFANLESIQNLDDSLLEAFKYCIPEIKDAELRGRIAHIIWLLKKKEYSLAPIAVDAYLHSAESLKGNWFKAYARIEQALNISLSLRNEELKQNVLSKVHEYINIYLDNSISWMPIKLSELLQASKLNNELTPYITRLSMYASNSLKLLKFEEARAALNICIEYSRKRGNSKQTKTHELNYAETYQTQAATKIKGQSPNYIEACHFQKKAVESFDRFQAKEEHDKAYKILLSYQHASRDNMQEFSGSIDLSDLAVKASKEVSGHSFLEALWRLARISLPISFQKVLEQEEKMDSEFVFCHIIPTTYIDREGKIIGDNASIEDRAYRSLNFYQTAQAQGVIEPARIQINREHYVAPSYFLPVLQENPFIPPGREIIYAQGLYYGMVGDFLLSAHLLIPQIENSLRFLVKKNGERVSWFNKGIQDEYLMGKLFGEHQSTLIEIFGNEDIVFNLIGLLNRKGFGSNFRNLLAHGLLEESDFYSPNISYLWWLILHIVFLPVAFRRSSPEEQTDEL